MRDFVVTWKATKLTSSTEAIIVIVEKNKNAVHILKRVVRPLLTTSPVSESISVILVNRPIFEQDITQRAKMRRLNSTVQI
jgi:hypothetical protein